MVIFNNKRNALIVHGRAIMTTSNGQQARIQNTLSIERMTTLELEAVLKQQGSPCPDDLARTLNVMRRKGLIKGAPCPEKGAWVWWVEE